MDVKDRHTIQQMSSSRFSLRRFFQQIVGKRPILHPPPSLILRNEVITPTLQAPQKKPSRGKAKKEPVAKNPYKKQKISAALREQVWIQRIGKTFEAKCMVTWCKNKITVFDFQCGHDIPESKGGPTNLANLYPICGKCNLSMSNTYTFQEWCKLYEAVSTEEESQPQVPLPPAPLPPPPTPPPPRKSFFFWFGKQQHPTSTS